PREDGLVRITLKKPCADGTLAVAMYPISLLCRLATSVPPPRFHTVRYAGVLAPASEWRPHLAPEAAQGRATKGGGRKQDRTHECRPGADDYRPWAEPLARSFAADVLRCPRCEGRLKLVAIIKDPARIAHHLTANREPTEVKARSPSRGPPY